MKTQHMACLAMAVRVEPELFGVADGLEKGQKLALDPFVVCLGAHDARSVRDEYLNNLARQLLRGGYGDSWRSPVGTGFRRLKRV